MSLHRVHGHTELRRLLGRAAHRASVPRIVLLHGMSGVGKQRLALWLGQALLCDEPTVDGPCGGCRPCRMTLSLEHPDLHWYFPLPRPKGASSPEKLADALEEARWQALSDRRSTPLYGSWNDELEGIYLATARAVRLRAQKRPSMGDRQVFVLGRAEALASQESSPEAANALLKLLEEPPDHAWFVLTSDEVGRVLPTIRSRSVVVHVPPLSLDEVEGLLREERGFEASHARELAGISRGSVGRALAFAPGEDGGPGPLTEHRRDAFRILQAALAAGPGRGWALALQQGPTGGRALAERLLLLEDWLRDLAALASGAGAAIGDPRARKALEELIARTPVHPLSLALAVACVEEARDFARGNGNPQLVLARLVRDLRRHLEPQPA